MSYQRLYPEPQATASFKQTEEDFQVREILGYSLTKEGEHIYIHVQKKGLNTVFLAEQLAKYAGISAKNVSYAGLKDRNALTEQWFGVHMPGKETPDFSLFELDGYQFLEQDRHNKKLRVGGLKGNQFVLTLKDVSDMTALIDRLFLIKEKGVPNYFGVQRFGREGNNITQALRWAEGEIKVKDRHKKSFYLSAIRSEIFNQMVSQRIDDNLFNSVLFGDAVQLAGRGSWFIANEDLALIQKRLDKGELVITAPLIGDGELGTKDDALSFESAILTSYDKVWELLKRQRVETHRRAVVLRPENMQWQQLDATTLTLSFELPAGSYATSVLREAICHPDLEVS